MLEHFYQHFYTCNILFYSWDKSEEYGNLGYR